MRTLAVALCLLSAAAAADPCPHSFFPLRSGTTWLYRLGSGERELRMEFQVRAVRAGKGEQIAQVASRVTDATGKQLSSLVLEYRCASDGLHVDPPLGRASGPDGQAIDVKISDRRGVTLPPPDALSPGSAWQEGYTVEMAAAGRKATIRREAKLRVVGSEVLAVEAGSFPAIHVESEEEVRMAGREAPSRRTVDIWYGQGVGMIRTRGSEGTLELVRFTEGAKPSPPKRAGSATARPR